MIDVHCHLLPQIDDGSDCAEKSLQQMKLMDDGGITDAFLTSHFMRGLYKYERSDYDKKLSAMQAKCAENGLKLRLHPGFEIFVQPNILADIEKNNLVMGNSRYVMVESDLNGLPEDFYNYIFPLLRKGYKPILAHAERYVSIMKHPRDARHLIGNNIYIQINSGSLLGQYGEKVRQTAWILMRNGWAHLIGSDDHGRVPYGSYFKALELLRDDLDEHVVELLSTEFPQMILDNKSIPYKYVYIQPSYSHSHRRKKSLWRRIFH
ncbi:MAG TPA: capsular biosynthesis protein [Candidatus Cloacimonadota bacterium]|jgi:protein-tyrosine phosphatase|nr:capsular biosynthesis protein [Candidatus Cloacimonadota bacterium]HPB08502.1 capsular biosynthesis protein [Candidatus Cloacimonadota bacterium]HQL13682.1 capsular biosynthesis protein [Candidatus Cloacimonadota bacterium]HQO43975.1 capsular biosynthesis protein [Candidatus Cloacimonadota bacterium]HQP16982.1 capsular biosynthesis protein [Candidatus Cloacimonadota bacterium]